MIRPLIINEDALATAKAILEYAEKHPYIANTKPVPGDDENFIGRFNDYTVVFSFTHANGIKYRHLSVSIPARGKFANPITVFTIATMFGFTGWKGGMPSPPQGWGLEINEAENCVVVAQPIEMLVPKEDRN